uniref:Uncharacterized protein n=1 Tax=viral metagenome TaxID=1070528 RepID=A0A6M3K4X0_9ZZZZ
MIKMNTLDQTLFDLTHLTIDQMLELIKKSDSSEKRKFKTTGPTGSLEGTILDVDLGLLKFDGQDGFVMASEFSFSNDITWEVIK